jgi:hypothetical protein
MRYKVRGAHVSQLSCDTKRQTAVGEQLDG